jgi:hypothetical protein
MLAIISVIGVIGMVLSIAVKLICVQIGCTGAADQRED